MLCRNIDHMCIIQGLGNNLLEGGWRLRNLLSCHGSCQGEASLPAAMQRQHDQQSGKYPTHHSSKAFTIFLHISPLRPSTCSNPASENHRNLVAEFVVSYLRTKRDSRVFSSAREVSVFAGAILCGRVFVCVLSCACVNEQMALFYNVARE